MSASSPMRATFAAGCFWGVEDTFRKLPGVIATTVGYTGGQSDNPTYHEVCSGRTGHAEAIQIEFDPEAISYGTLLDEFWGCHDPTTQDRQGADVGSQYRSAIFCHDTEQIQLAEQSRDTLDLKGILGQAIVTQIVPASTFHPAEEYHQGYFQKRLGGKL